MLSEKMEEALNGQLNRELYAAYIYLAMSAYFEDQGLKGFASWMRAQSAEELTHAMKFYDYILSRGGRVALSRVEDPPGEWDSPLAAFEGALAHERKVTGWIAELKDLAIEERDHATRVFLQWFVTEQVEEEESVGEVIQRIRLAGEAPGGLFMVDKELGQRQVNLDTPAEGE